MPRKPNMELLMKLKAILEDPNIPSYEKTNKALAEKLGISERHVRRLKKKLKYSGRRGRPKKNNVLFSEKIGHFEKSDIIQRAEKVPRQISSGKRKAQLKAKESLESFLELARKFNDVPEVQQALERYKHELEKKGWLPEETSVSCGVSAQSRTGVFVRSHDFLLGLFGGLVGPRVHCLWLEGVFDGCFRRVELFGWGFVWCGNLSFYRRVFDGFEVRVFGNDRVVVIVRGGEGGLDDVGLLDVWSRLCVELFKLKGDYVSMSELRVKKIEINHDHGSVEYVLDKIGSNMITFQTLANTFIRLYRSKSRLEIGGPPEQAYSLYSTFQLLAGGMRFQALNELMNLIMKLTERIGNLERKIGETPLNQPASPQAQKEQQRIILPKPVKTDSHNTQLKLTVNPSQTKSFKVYQENKMPVQPNSICPFFRNDGCTANLSGYSSYVEDEIVRNYCISGRHRECCQYRYYMERYGGC